MQLENLQEADPATLQCPARDATNHRAGGSTGADGVTIARRPVALKFGGTSLLGPERMLNAGGLAERAAQRSPVVVVVSAMKGVTDRLLDIGRLLAGCKRARARSEAEALLHFHHDVLAGLSLPLGEHDRVTRELRSLGHDLLHEVSSSASTAANAELFDRLGSYGERLSARLFAASLASHGVPSVPVASSDFVLTCDTFRDARVHREQSRQRGRRILLPLLQAGIVPVVTGFIGATSDGRITTLGRNSSDFSGAFVAHIVDSAELVIWTDVDGIFSANPNTSPQAQLIHDLSYDEAHALAAGGATVLHPQVLPLAAETEMTVWVRNTFRPHLRGTRIGALRNLQNSMEQGGLA